MKYRRTEIIVFTNHSLHTTGLSDLFQAGVLDKIIKESLGHLPMDGLQMNILLLSKKKVFQRYLVPAVWCVSIHQS